MNVQIIASHGRMGWAKYAATPVSLALWWGLAHSGLVDALLLPSPERVLQAIGDIGPDLLWHTAATVARVTVGFCVAASAGAALAVWMQRTPIIFAYLDGLIETSRPVPPVALIPFFLLLFGFSEFGRLLLVVLGGMLVITVTCIEALHATPPALLRFGLLLDLPKGRFYRLILIPAAAPKLVAGFRIAFSLVLSLVVVSEFLGARFGLGYLISVSKVTLTTPTMLLCIILLGFIGLIGDSGIRWTFRMLSRWEPTAKEVER